MNFCRKPLCRGVELNGLAGRIGDAGHKAVGIDAQQGLLAKRADDLRGIATAVVLDRGDVVGAAGFLGQLRQAARRVVPERPDDGAGETIARVLMSSLRVEAVDFAPVARRDDEGRARKSRQRRADLANVRVGGKGVVGAEVERAIGTDLHVDHVQLCVTGQDAVGTRAVGDAGNDAHDPVGLHLRNPGAVGIAEINGLVRTDGQAVGRTGWPGPPGNPLTMGSIPLLQVPEPATIEMVPLGCMRLMNVPWPLMPA